MMRSFSQFKFCFKISIFFENNGFRKKMYRTLNIYLFIRYNFCKLYFLSRSTFIDIKWKNLLKTFVFSFDLENQICGYFHHHIRNQRLKICGYSEFQINRRHVLFGTAPKLLVNSTKRFVWRTSALLG